MIEGKLKNGFCFEIEDTALDNMELLDALAETDESPMYIGKVAELLLGRKQKKDLYNHLRAETGNVPVAAVSDAIVEIFNQSSQGKN